MSCACSATTIRKWLNHFSIRDARPRPRAWNRLKLSLAGDTVTLELNGAVVYERPLEPTNQRLFGLFHYADETEVRVRDIVYRGNWPRTIPAELLSTTPAGGGPPAH